MKFTAKKRFEREYNGDAVAYTLLAPDVKLMSDMASFNVKDENGENIFQLNNAPDQMTKMKNLMEPFIEKLEVTDSDGIEITVEDVFKFPFFFNLVVMMSQDLFSLGGLTVEDVKKSGDTLLGVTTEPTPV